MNSKKHLGHTARKRFGQNFLHDTSVIQGIVASILSRNWPRAWCINGACWRACRSSYGGRA